MLFNQALSLGLDRVLRGQLPALEFQDEMRRHPVAFPFHGSGGPHRDQGSVFAFFRSHVQDVGASGQGHGFGGRGFGRGHLSPGRRGHGLIVRFEGRGGQCDGQSHALVHQAHQRRQRKIQEFRAAPYGVHEIDHLVPHIDIGVIEGEVPLFARGIGDDEFLAIGDPGALAAEKAFQELRGYVADALEGGIGKGTSLPAAGVFGGLGRSQMNARGGG